MNKPLVSIVTVSYNQEKYIRAALDSFIMQKTNFDFEVVVSDDASTDNTPKIIAEYAKKHPNIFKVTLRQKNVGVANNFIKTMQSARGKYIALCEGDDYWIDEFKLQKQVDYFNANPGTSICFNPSKVIFQNNKVDESIWPTNIVSEELTVAKLIMENFIPTNSVMYKKQDYNNLSNKVMPIDWYLHLYHAQFGKIGFIPDVMSVYRRHNDGLWWNSHESPALHWKTYGIRLLTILEIVRKIYGKDPKLDQLILQSSSNIFKELIKSGKELGEDLAGPAAESFSSLAAGALELLNTNLLELKEQSMQYKQEVTKLENDVHSLKANNFKLKSDVQLLRNSRVIGKIIKARESAGDVRHRTKALPRKAIIKSKHMISGIAPEVIKPVVRSLLLKPAKKVLQAYDKSRSKNSNMYQNGVEYVPNSSWNTKAPLVSIVVPYFNRADTIDETILSIFEQTFNNYEVLLVDDGSSDQESIKKLEQLRIDYPTIIILEQKNQGVAAARNNGINKARGKYIVCLDSDDIIDPTYVEKCLIVLELNQDIGLTTTYRKDFGVINDEFRGAPYEPIELFTNNMVTTAAMFRKVAWEVSGGYKSDIGYEDWDFWLTLAEHGFWGKLIPEFLFSYRVAMSSRFMEDKEAHWNNIKIIQNMHKQYAKKIKKIASQRRASKQLTTKETLFKNLANKVDYRKQDIKKPRVLVTIPWMTFGGAETLIYNYCQEIKSSFDITFMTGLESKHEWEYKFKEITTNVYHLANLFEEKKYYIEFILNYIKTRDIQTLHIIHNGFTFEMLNEIKKHFPDLKVIVTMFNDRVDYFLDSTNYRDYIDVYTSDNSRVTKHYQDILGNSTNTKVIPNGIDCYSTFRADLFDRAKERETLGLSNNDIAVFFVGRLSEEKNPDVFVEVAKKIDLMKDKKSIKFYMIGDGGMRHHIESMLKTKGIKNFTYLGYKSEVAKYLSAADIFVLPSSIEGFPLSILEAMAMRLAVIASDVGAVAEVLHDGLDGFVVQPGNIEEITKNIIKLESDRDLLKKVKVRARNKVEENYSNTILGRNYTDLYNGAVK